REDYAKNKEAEDDAKGREHIEIPDGVATVEVDGENYNVIRSLEEFKLISRNESTQSDNYILGCDLNLADYNGFDESNRYDFRGKFNGNNYKIYSTEQSKINKCLFSSATNAEITNVILSATDNNGTTSVGCLLVRGCGYSVIRNCINYGQPAHVTHNSRNPCSGLIGIAQTSIVENCYNYCDFYVGGLCGGAIVGVAAYATLIRNCKNYGNIIGCTISPTSHGVGGIVGSTVGDCSIENCENYGNIGGTSSVGGILGIEELEDRASNPWFNDYLTFCYLKEDLYYENHIIRNCNNYGNIYLIKDEGETKFEHTNSDYHTNILLVGGIAGSATKVENCKNEGNFYGFENLGKGIQVEYTGGVVGIALQVVDCSNTGTMVIHKGRAISVGDIYGYIL
ncbi:MAG: hypothetical protein K2G70_03150, partial [Turicibacter sp.]|nr:hypothetical protein [Turicibacter sp.]